MTLVKRDLTEAVRIDAIPMKSLDTIKEWLASIDVKFYESKINLQWPAILKSIREDPEGFVESGGWDFLDAEGGSDDDESDDGDEEFAPSDDDSDEDDESDDVSHGEGVEPEFSRLPPFPPTPTPLPAHTPTPQPQDSDSDASLEDEESDDDEDGDADLSEDERGMSWDELEKEAARADRKHAASDDDEGERRSKKKSRR